MAMYTTSVFSKNLEAYVSGFSLIVNQGGTRSSKSYSIMQLLLEIAIRSKTKKIISVVSYALPHLKLGVMRDFDDILLSRGINPSSIKNISESFYKIGHCIIEFFGVDNLGKVHGPARDILFVNEANYIKKEVFEQLTIRTKGATFIDFNPTREFWYHTEIQGKQKHELIKSTYKDNEFLTAAQIERIEAKKSNPIWWRVYGEGELGRLEGAILTNWKYGQFDNILQFSNGLDFGFGDPDAMVKVGIDRKLKKIYVDELIYQTGLTTSSLCDLIESKTGKDTLIIAESASPRTIADIKQRGFNIKPVVKGKIEDGIKLLQDYELIITENSFNLVRELNSWCWLDKKSGIAVDYDNHLIDALRYNATTLIKTDERTEHRALRIKRR